MHSKVVVVIFEYNQIVGVYNGKVECANGTEVEGVKVLNGSETVLIMVNI